MSSEEAPPPWDSGYFNASSFSVQSRHGWHFYVYASVLSLSQIYEWNESRSIFEYQIERIAFRIWTLQYHTCGVVHIVVNNHFCQYCFCIPHRAGLFGKHLHSCQ